MFKEMKILLTLIIPYLHKTIIVFKSLFSQKGIILIPALAISIPILSTKQHIGLMLIVLIIIDFLTGLAVSKRKKKKAEKLDTALKNKNLFQSKLFKDGTGVKLLLYSLTIFITYWAEYVLKIKTFNISISKIDLNGTLVILLIWVTVELYSIIFENIKDLGFDVLAVLKKIVAVFKSVKKEIK